MRCDKNVSNEAKKIEQRAGKAPKKTR